jgi:thiopeptide-type bacteriocin biosynthesis protein
VNARPAAPAAFAQLYQPTGFFVLRLPVLPFDTLLQWDGLLAATRTPEAAGPAFEADRQRVRESLVELACRPDVREALYLASPSLEQTLDGWVTMPDGESRRKIDRAVLRYVSRMSSRPTPFGLFASCSLGTTGPRTSFVVPPLHQAQKHLRLDTEVFFALTDQLLADPAVSAQLSYQANPSRYELGGRLRYTHFHRKGGARGQPVLVDIEPTPAIGAVLKAAAQPRPFPEICQAVRQDRPAVSERGAQKFIARLIDEGLLVPALLPAATGVEPFAPFREALAPVAQLADLGARLDLIQHEIEALGREPPGVTPARYRALNQTIEATYPDFTTRATLQLDLIRPLEQATLGPEVQAELLRAAQLFHRLGATGEAPLASFKKRFHERYEQQAVPLFEVLDDEFGLGFTRQSFSSQPPLLADLPDAAPAAPGSWTALDALQLRLLESPPTRPGEVELTESMLDAWPAPLAPLPAAFALIASLHANGADSGDFSLHCHSYQAPSAVPMLGRFCHADPALERAVRQALAGEETPADCLLADVAHLPIGQVGNIVLRPVLRPFEIVCNGRSGAPLDQQIPLSDLLVSVRHDRVELHSIRLGKQVLIRPANALNHRSEGDTPLYTFLGEIAQQDAARHPAWRWGVLAGAPFLPRVRAGHLVLSPAQWQLGPADLKPLASLEGAPLFQAVQRLRSRLQLPRWVRVGERDNLLSIDLDNGLSVELLGPFFRREQPLHLEELLAWTLGRYAAGIEGSYTHEMVVPFTRVPPATQPAPRPVARRSPAPGRALSLIRSFPPGSDILTAKLYSSRPLADRWLPLLAHVAHRAMEQGIATGWFFLRYNDPDEHLRFRLFGNPALWSETLPALHRALQPWLRPEFIRRLVLDTYEREIERYGGEQAMPLAEQIFHADSEACVALLSLAEELDPDDRWKITGLGVDRLLGDFGWTPAEKLQRVAAWSQGGARNQPEPREFQHALGAKARKLRGALDAILSPEVQEPMLQGAQVVLARRSRALAPVVRQLRELERQGQLTTPLEVIVASHAHMFTNRMFLQDGPRQETVLYALLERGYRARTNRPAPPQEPRDGSP